MWKAIKQSLDSPESYVSLALGLAVVVALGMLIFNFIKSESQSPLIDEQAAQTETAATTTLPTHHTVSKGDTLWSVSEKYYKSGYNWVDIQKANNLTNANMIEEGQTLTIPDVKPITTTKPTSGEVSAASIEKKYTVVAGDYLWKIAQMQYGDPYKWSVIAKANNITNPNVIHVGNVLELP